MMPIQYATRPGSRYPGGATVDSGGVNFAVFSRNATAMELLLYESADCPEPFQVIRLDPEINRTFFSWHVYVEGLTAGVHYTWRVDGPDDTKRSGRRFDRTRELLDPWAGAVTDRLWDRNRACLNGGGAPSMRAAVVSGYYDWEGDRPLESPSESTIIYELHVGGFTRHPSSKVAHPGTFRGLIEKIPYLKDLGITHVELMPVMAFDEQDLPESVAALGLKNFWGYSTHSFYSPHPGYCVTPEAGTHAHEFRDMVKALHRAGIGVILDVVFNHTAEGGARGPVINFKGFVNELFYHLEPNDRSVYRDYTGCGNTVNCNHPLPARFIIRCLEGWVREMHVDGFRFDLASVMARGEDGNPMRHPPVLWNIEFSDVLLNTRIIAEAWDAAGLYQVGTFPGLRWAEWNGRYRDVMRRFVRGEPGLAGQAATNLSGSSDLYQPLDRLPTNSINYITCHDGFTLNDLVSFNDKHNDANGENNRDGSNDNLSWNCGVEGDADDPQVLALRRRQVKNYMAILLLSQGVPMILAGDEVLRTQRGNNNCYCQDNELGWFDWTLMEKNRDVLRFVREMIAFRKRHPCLARTRFLTGRKQPGRSLPDVSWHGIRLNEPPWSDPDARTLACTLSATEDHEEDLHVILNMASDPVSLDLPEIAGLSWHRAVDTWLPSPEDILGVPDQLPVRDHRILARAHCVMVFEGRPERN
ncbi:MAG TPA: glycogen debranching protein GlgX [Syntrophobacter fumaroxidans]|nr:glycogen debranching protein GlgX [Syntrophobacter fumaroxidans]